MEFYIYNNSSGISEVQKALALKIEKKYPELINDLEIFLNTKIKEKDSKHSFFSTLSILKDLEVGFINIPSDPTDSSFWEINYVEKRGLAIYGIEIKNWLPTELGVSA
ncbi:hypothetical protein [Chondrinema litorale]|uniref:hypothetical protein n=1 Tax=Chondrinema litorale TaxID=2994555 RepID=UPI00254305B7|nr:hypothetical protein [Chondrinema litorale]UZR99628.1 hypothetical protein OQ292_37195 [Chondrinema litorale]